MRYLLAALMFCVCFVNGYAQEEAEASAQETVKDDSVNVEADATVAR